MNRLLKTELQHLPSAAQVCALRPSRVLNELGEVAQLRLGVKPDPGRLPSRAGC